jgi:hypothetical protein
MSLNECALEVSRYIVRQVATKQIVLPMEVTLRFLEKETGHRPQNIGMAFDVIERILKANGIAVRKSGVPMRLQLRIADASGAVLTPISIS